MLLRMSVGCLCCSSSGQGASHGSSDDSTDSELSCAVLQVVDLGDVTADAGPVELQRSLGLSPDIVNTAVFTKEVVTLELGVLETEGIPETEAPAISINFIRFHPLTVLFLWPTWIHAANDSDLSHEWHLCRVFDMSRITSSII